MLALQKMTEVNTRFGQTKFSSITKENVTELIETSIAMRDEVVNSLEDISEAREIFDGINTSIRDIAIIFWHVTEDRFKHPNENMPKAIIHVQDELASTIITLYVKFFSDIDELYHAIDIGNEAYSFKKVIVECGIIMNKVIVTDDMREAYLEAISRAQECGFLE
jgi:hypothetical protein